MVVSVSPSLVALDTTRSEKQEQHQLLNYCERIRHWNTCSKNCVDIIITMIFHENELETSI